MPQNNPNQKKKKKGHAPAHQNKYAFKHNPKSKLTEKILSSPNEGVCKKCHDKIEWRKKYRKYKPLKQPSTCNVCRKRNVKAAYHTICNDCTLVVGEKLSSSKTTDVVKEKIENLKIEGEEPVKDENEEGGETTADKTQNNTSEEKKTKTTTAPTTRKIRACAICATEPAMKNDNNDEDDDDDDAREGRRLKLREIRALERKAEREERLKNQKKDGSNDDDDDDDENDDDGEDGGYESYDDYDEDENNLGPVVHVM